ncbi:MAG: BREX-1 system adenine-specific DNA-methyltransferase PglX, partial [Ignavibacteria bacterium]|nr:BREX-1 system adenine-specific DNA-methyltransferase PglX [Ignavibacteria bacterium]
NKIYFNSPISKKEFEDFRSKLVDFLKKINPNETEEHNKNYLRDFLKATFYQDFEVNTAGFIDLAIYNGKDPNSSIGVIFEVKSPKNKTSLPTETDINRRSFQEALLYYLQEKIDNNNHSIKHIVITNCLQWFIFFATDFEKIFARNAELVGEYKNWKSHQFDTISTDFFYSNIASKYLSESDISIPCVSLDLEPLRNKFLEGRILSLELFEDEIFVLFKLFSPPNLLKLPFANDNNSLNREFYEELLHILGLEEVGTDTVYVKRLPEHKRHPGSFIENTIEMLRESPNFSNNLSENEEFEIALELVITWLNRILFLKLLEGILITHSPNDPSVRFLNKEIVEDFDALYELFFDVLAVPINQRKSQVRTYFKNIPFLNSSLFEKTDYEKKYLSINQLKDRYEIPFYFHTVLRDENGRKKQGDCRTLYYLLDFLNAFNFASVEENLVQEQPKTIINAAVLGLIFEKVNGYRDGSFFTPSAITMFMARDAIRTRLLALFNETYGWNAAEFEDLPNYISKNLNRDKILEYNRLFNTIRICDPAVGSGHFLVSCLNELIACKSELGILADEVGYVLPIKAQVENDELILYDKEGNLFVYNPKDIDSNRIQKAIFKEKLFLIENCLFGVDINPKSVYITRLRLWIELLKSAFYNEKNELETLPNIDLNIKCGDSLLSRFALDDTLVSQYNQQLISDYKVKVKEYKNTTDKSKRERILKEIENIKNNFRTNIVQRSTLSLKKSEIEAKIQELYNAKNSFIENNYNREKLEKELERYKKELEQIESELEKERAESQKIRYFEWRFEFPEVLDDEGKFVGFDIVIGNPPYGLIFSENIKEYLKRTFVTAKSIKGIQKGSLDSYTLFIEVGFNILKRKGVASFIVPISITSSDSVIGLHRLLEQNCSKIKISSFSVRPEPIFPNAVVNTSIILFFKDFRKVEKILCTKMYRKKGKLNLQYIFNNLEFIDVLDYKLPGRYPKISLEIEKNILKKIFNQKIKIRDLKDEKGAKIFYRFAGGRYFKVITNYSTGSAAERSIVIKKDLANVIGAILSSNLFFWYYQIFSDNLNLKTYEIESFGIPVEKLNDKIIKEIEDVYTRYLLDIEKNVILRKTKNYKNISLLKEYKIAKSKHLIDQIDDLIGPLYNLTTEEIDFIKNYEVEFRIQETNE